ncbi:MAG: hypothetical protein ACHQ1H_01580 [Nitrososphaerales archaeon]
MSFKEEIDDAILHVSSIRQLVLLSRRPLATDKTSEEKDAKRKESLDSAKKVLGDLPAEKTDNIIALSVKSSPIEIDEILHKLERAEFLLEDIKKGRDKKNNLKTVIDSFKSTPAIQEGLLAVTNLKKIIEVPT